VKSENANEFVAKHIGGLLFPPNTEERLRELGPLTEYEYDVRSTCTHI